MTDKLCNREAEADAIRWAWIGRPDALAALGALECADFGDQQMRRIWGAILELRAAGSEVDLVTTAAKLGCSDEQKRWLAGLLDGVPGSRPTALAAYLRERRVVREWHRLLSEMQAQIAQGADGAAVRGAVASALQETAALEVSGIPGQPALLKQAFDELEAEVEGKQIGISTGLRNLDVVLRGGGWLPSQLVYVGARPSRGKTALLLRFAVGAARTGRRALFFSLEMPPAELWKRLLISEAGVDVGGVRSGALNKAAAFQRLGIAYGKLEKLPLPVTSNRLRNPDQIQAEIARVEAEVGKVDLVLIDYLGYVRARDPKLSLYQQVTENSNALHGIAQETGLPVICGVQLNRVPDTRKDRRPSLSDFRDSGGVEQDADVALLIHQDPKVQEEQTDTIASGRVELLVAKQRNGYTGRVDLWFSKETATFESVAREGSDAA